MRVKSIKGPLKSVAEVHMMPAGCQLPIPDHIYISDKIFLIMNESQFQSKWILKSPNMSLTACLVLNTHPSFLSCGTTKRTASFLPFSPRHIFLEGEDLQRSLLAPPAPYVHQVGLAGLQGAARELQVVIPQRNRLGLLPLVVEHVDRDLTDAWGPR